MPETYTNYTLLGEKITITAPSVGYRGGIDPILLSSLAKGEGKVMDLGCGIGTAGLALAARKPEIELTMLDISAKNIALAKHNADQNHISCSFLEHDIKNKTDLIANHFDEVIINPPYFENGHYYEDKKTRKSLSNHEGEGKTILKDWLNCANYILHAKGTLSLIHRAERLDDILSHLKQIKMGAITITPLWPRTNEKAKLVLIQAQKGSKKPLTLNHGLTLHEDGKHYTSATQKILYHGYSLSQAITSGEKT